MCATSTQHQHRHRHHSEMKEEEEETNMKFMYTRFLKLLRIYGKINKKEDVSSENEMNGERKRRGKSKQK